MQERYKAIYFNYLLRLKQHVADKLIELLPFLLADLIKRAFQEKLRDH